MVLAVIPYIYASVAVVKVVHDHGLPRRTFLTYKWIGIAAVAYGLATVKGSTPGTVVNAMVVLLLTVPLYAFFIRSMEAAAARKAAAAAAAPATPASAPARPAADPPAPGARG